MDKETYYFHQTPKDLAADLVKKLPLTPNDVLLEPFRGEGAFFDSFPASNPKLWAEIDKGIDYTSVAEPFDWVITNPPFKLDTGSKRVNSFWFLIDYYTCRARKGVAFLANDRCLASLTPTRLEALKTKGWGISKLIVCSVKKWRGRYFFIVLERKPPIVEYLLGTY